MALFITKLRNSQNFWTVRCSEYFPEFARSKRTLITSKPQKRDCENQKAFRSVHETCYIFRTVRSNFVFRLHVLIVCNPSMHPKGLRTEKIKVCGFNTIPRPRTPKNVLVPLFFFFLKSDLTEYSNQSLYSITFLRQLRSLSSFKLIAGVMGYGTGFPDYRNWDDKCVPKFDTPLPICSFC
jgi:hypothetical protein